VQLGPGGVMLHQGSSRHISTEFVSPSPYFLTSWGNNQIDAASIKILRSMGHGLFLILFVGQLMMVSFDVLHALYIPGHL
jgi:hypothetical protein